ncbi:TonB-dependent receptor domain-containing protein [Limnohabitans sp. Bal53]|uniref:TonB-dependent receptor family protein n=1 Tax=Limnohabitans sp. Bal53 TaxID=1977910 RepID=UPI000D3403E8|nr:TonB-dependent receptor [Limnohabitans sp. Bal53]PUE43060.1 TonB-dependent receptor [Limnohabitans sp. Bal53]
MSLSHLSSLNSTHPARLAPVAWAIALMCAAGAQAQSVPASAAEADTDAGALSPVVVVSAQRSSGGVWRGAASVDVVGGDELREGQAQINLSEGLGRVPGLVIRNRQNYAQDLQISVRGYGARATFGVRGVRLFVDGIPASAPDGSGQAANFPLGSADRIEVVRGPMAALYGASSGGALLLYTEDGQQPAQWRTGVVAGSDGLWRASTQLTGQTGTKQAPGWSYALDVSGFATDGTRPQSEADRNTANMKLSRSHEGGRTVLVFNRHSSSALDPQGLDRAAFDDNPDQTNAGALTFNTRKTVSQTQLGLAFEQALGNGHKLELMGYGGQRQVVQFQSIPPGAQTPPRSSGAVIDLDRDYWGWNARWRHEGEWQGGRLALSAGLASDHQSDKRKGYENFVGSTLGVQGKLRRDEVNRAQTLDPYVQAEWRTQDLTLMGGVRQARTEYESSDRYIVGANGDDSGSKSFKGTLPVVGVRWQWSPTVQAFASIGKGYEIPTLNEVAYPSGGVSGFNTELIAARSTSAELGMRGRADKLRWSATAFDIRTDDEIVVQNNTGGRTTFQNAGRTLRQGLELAGEWRIGDLTLTSAYTWMDANYRDAFKTCVQTLCPNVNPQVEVPAGNRMPGLPKQQLFAQAAWDTGWLGSRVTLEARHVGSVMVNDLNTDAAAAHTVFNLGVQFEQERGDWTLKEFVRVDNLTDRQHVGSVIVNDGNKRFFEPGPGRKLLLGLEAQRRF